MIKYFCDTCFEEIENQHYKIEIPFHVCSENLSERGYEKMEKGKMQPFSGKTQSIMVCLTCYNKIMYPLWQSILDLKRSNT